MITTILQALYLFLPAYAGNMLPVFTAAIMKKKFSTPIDFGKKWKGKRLTGDHKTWRGLIIGIIGGTIIFYLQRHLYHATTYWHSLSLINYDTATPLIGTTMALGALTGDLVKSFFKRRQGKKPGTNWFPYDQLDYIIGGLAGLIIFYQPPLRIIITIIILSFLLHLIAGWISAPLKNIGNTKT